MGEYVERNGVQIDVEVAKRIKTKILRAEQLNHRTRELDDKSLIAEHLKVLQGEVKAVTED